MVSKHPLFAALGAASRRWAWLWLFLAATPVLAQPVPTTLVGTAGAAQGFELDGSIQAIRQSTVAAQANGSVMQLAVKAGDLVKVGQLLARIDARETQAALAGAEAGVAQAQAQLALARSGVERSRELRRTGFISQAALDVAETQLRAAEAGQAQAQAGRTQAGLARNFATATAPFDAVVQTTHVQAGDLAQAGRPLVTLYAPGALRALVMVPASRAAVARAATTARVQLPDGRWIETLRSTELPALDALSQTYEWRLDLAPEFAAGLAPGQAVRVRFSGALATAGAATAPAVTTLPDAAILRRGELTAVYVAVEGRFVLRAVRLGAAVADTSHVLLAGLKAGERVALDPVRAGLAGAKPAAP